jgi:hypothetical protein
MKTRYRNLAALTWAALALAASPLWAQKPKSQKESQAILAVQVAKTPDERVQAIEKVLTDFADTEFKVPLLQMAVQAEQQKDDYAQVVFYSNRLLEADPKNVFAQVTLASETARHTRENDLDRDEKLAKVDKWAKDAIEGAKTMPKPRPDVPDADWEGFKKDMQAQGYEALGMADAVRKNFPSSISNYRLSLSTASNQNPTTLVRLAGVYVNSGKLDDAVFTLDKAIADPNTPAQVKTIAETMKNDVTKRKAAAAPNTAAPPPAPATAPPAGGDTK